MIPTILFEFSARSRLEHDLEVMGSRILCKKSDESFFNKDFNWATYPNDENN